MCVRVCARGRVWVCACGWVCLIMSVGGWVCVWVDGCVCVCGCMHKCCSQRLVKSCYVKSGIRPMQSGLPTTALNYRELSQIIHVIYEATDTLPCSDEASNDAN